MARLQILQLPEGAGDDRPPFVLVVDQYQPLRYIQGIGLEPQPVDEFAGFAEQIGARGVLVFQETVEIPANELPSCDAEVSDSSVGSDASFKEAASAKLRHLGELLEEARSWARHGYEIGQKHCGWTDHGVAPDWLTEGWPPHIDSCEHLKQMAEFDEALTRVRGLPTEPEVMNSEQERPDIWLHGYHCGVVAAKSAARPREETS